MNRLTGFLIGSFLAAALFLTPATGNTMEISQYDQMDVQDKSRYDITLFKQAARLLFHRGDKGGAKKIADLFSEKSTDVSMSKGQREFLGVLNGLRDMKNPQQAPHVEHAMIIALNRHGIDLRPYMDDFMQVAKNFKPSDK